MRWLGQIAQCLPTHRRQWPGITNGLAGSLNIAPLIAGEDGRFTALLRPNRKSFTSTGSVGEFARGQAGVVKNYAEFLGNGEIKSADDLEPGEGGILRDGASKIALYKGTDGLVLRRSAACTHMACLVHWNSFEKCWACPCHGSQFAPDGSVLNGPAVRPLPEVD